MNAKVGEEEDDRLYDIWAKAEYAKWESKTEYYARKARKTTEAVNANKQQKDASSSRKITSGLNSC